ncbi:replication protein [Pseudomonas sp. TSRC2-2]|uniref:replication protein n=1 Tax=unclassified Pseudomonas TaxID=196821 RepID=UPI003CFABDA1
MSNVFQLNAKSPGGFTRMDNDLYEALIRADLSGRELRVALAIHRQTAGYNLDSARIAASYIAEMANIHREDVSRIIGELLRQRVIYRDGGSKAPIGISPVREWRIDAKNNRKTTTQKEPQCGVSTTSLVAFPPHNKDTNTTTTSDEVVVDAERQPEAAPEKISKVKTDACPHRAIVDLYHEILPELPAVTLINKTRQQHLQGRWREHEAHRDLAFWREYFESVKASNFLMGKVEGRFGTKPFRASFDWLIAPRNFVKVVEGNYHA